MSLSTPSPAHEASGIANNATLSWADSVASDYYKVYFGTNSAEVTAKSVNVYRGNVTSKAYDPRLDLTYGAKYYWLITAVLAGEDDVDSDVWEFTVIEEAPALPDAKKYKKKICSAANDKFFYDNDDSPPKQVELSGLTLDTSKAISMFELDQKVYIANDDILKVVDFVNTKLTLDTAMTVPPRRGQTITQANSNATMIVDYVAKGALTVIYGRTTSGTFTTNEADTLSGDTMSPTTRWPTDVALPTTPHHYTWGVYADCVETDEFGAMPPRATIGDRWRGRACLTGNSIDPHQWYLSRQLNPYDMMYGEDDEQSSVAGTDAKAGRVGDIVTASIPYSDDYKLYGSIGDLWLLRGDPAAGGTLDKLIEGIGIISNTAWCFDDAGNLYILDLKGMYKITMGLASIEPMTSDKIPNFTKDLALNPETQRIVLSFDPAEQGIVISVTTIETGANVNYFYDMQSGGFSPETYPVQDAIICSHYYDADDPEQRRLLFGCYDGHMRILDPASKSDDIGSMAVPATAAIDSYVLLGPVMIGANHNNQGRMNSLTVVTAGGKAGGTVPDSDDIEYAVFVGDDAETVIEKADAGTSIFSGTIPAPGRAKRVRRKARGVFAAVWLGIACSVFDEELVTNSDFDDWTDDDPDGWIVIAESGEQPEVSEVGSGETHGGSGTGACNIYSTGTNIGMTQDISGLVIGKEYIVSIVCSADGAGQMYVTEEGNDTWGFTEHVINGAQTFEFTFTAISTSITLGLWRKAVSNMTFDSVSVKRKPEYKTWGMERCLIELLPAGRAK